jgi:hypothetical protein
LDFDDPAAVQRKLFRSVTLHSGFRSELPFRFVFRKLRTAEE